MGTAAWELIKADRPCVLALERPIHRDAVHREGAGTLLARIGHRLRIGLGDWHRRDGKPAAGLGNARRHPHTPTWATQARCGPTRVVYGGSVNVANGGEIFAQPDVDAGLCRRRIP